MDQRLENGIQFFPLRFEEQARACGREATVRASDRLQERNKRRDTAGSPHDPAQNRGDLSSTVSEIRPEERTSDNRESQAAHLLAYVDLPSLLPSGQKPARFVPDDLDIGTDLVAVKRGLQDPATLPMSRFFESKDTVACEFSQQCRSGVAHKFMLLNDENLFNQVGIVNEVGVLMKKAKVR
jgi:hypothetical protein